MSSSTVVGATHRLTSFVGREVREQMFDKVASLLHDLDEGMRPLSVVAPYFPTAYHRKRDRSTHCFPPECVARQQIVVNPIMFCVVGNLPRVRDVV